MVNLCKHKCTSRNTSFILTMSIEPYYHARTVTLLRVFTVA